MNDLLLFGSVLGFAASALLFLALLKREFRAFIYNPAFRFVLFMLVVMSLIGIGRAQYQINQYSGNYGAQATEPPITYHRNLGIAVTNDSLNYVIQKPGSTNLSNDFEELYVGGQIVQSVNQEGSLSNFGTNAALHTLQNLGVLYGSNGTVTATEILSNAFATPFGAPPIILLSHNTNTCWALTVASNYFLITNNAGVQPIYWTAIGQVNQSH